MSLQIHCDHCDKSLVTKQSANTLIDETVRHVVLTIGQGESLRPFPDGRRDFCNYECVEYWANWQTAE